MNTMSTRIHPPPRRGRTGAVLASLIVATWVLAGCSASSDDASLSTADSAVTDSANALEASAGDSKAEAPTTDAAAMVTADRSVIVRGAMYMTVEDPIAAADRAAGIVQNSGGRIDARSETAPYEGNGGSASLTLRIPSDNLEPVVDNLRDLGTVDEFSTNSNDVTTQVTDLEAHISTLRASTTRIEALLLDAKDISDIIKLENELDGRQAELESLEARQRGLDDQVSMSTINLSLTTEPVVIIDDEPKTFWDGLESGWNGLAGFLSGGLVAVGLLLPWLALAALIILAAVVAVRTAKSRKARRAAGSPDDQASPKQPAQDPADGDR